MRYLLSFLLLIGMFEPAAADVPAAWTRDFPHTDFTRHTVPFSEIRPGGPPRDGIPAITEPVFVPVADSALDEESPVISLALGETARAYPLRVLMWHEIVNDRLDDMPVAVTWCPLCNSAVAFDRRLDGRPLTFGTTGRLRHSDMIMYDRETETWWQQALGEGIVGRHAGRTLTRLPARLESLGRFRARHPRGAVLVPHDPEARSYGRNPYVGYDRAERPFLYDGRYDRPLPPLARVVAVGDRAWSLEAVRRAGTLETEDGLRLLWQPGRRSAVDAATVAGGRDVGQVVVQRRNPEGQWRDVPYDMPFAFAFDAFHPEAPIHQ